MAEHLKGRVVVVGGGIAGALLAKHLQHHAQVTLIDPKEYFEISWASLRAMVEPCFAEKSVINYTDFLKQVRLVTSAATGITETEVLTAHGHRIPYDYLVVATGHNYSSPVTRHESLLKYQEEFNNIKSASSILIIGGGPTGVELAGEIAHEFPNKKITLVHRGSRLLGFIGAKASHKALDWLAARKVEVMFNQSIDSKSTSLDGIYRTFDGQTIAADFFFDCTGIPLGSSWLKDTFLRGCSDSQGRLVVDEHLQVKGHNNIFAIGDITNIQEMKQGYLAMRHADVTAKNLKGLLTIGNEAKLSSYKPGGSMAFVSLGKKEAIAQINCFTVSGRIPGLIKSGDLFVGRTRKTFGLDSNTHTS